ncbi:MAG TPA: hypothetical protein VFA61_02910 [Candidatus Udaeobacter sp.]|nr:hypothetical protein [Candidatus Udaeobacter sp.]
MDEKKKINGGPEFSATKKVLAGGVEEVKNGDRRFALCALANSAGQPTENLATAPW